MIETAAIGACYFRKQPLGRDPARRGLDPLRDQVGDVVVIPGLRCLLNRDVAGLVLLDDALDDLVGGPADSDGTPITAYVSVGGDYVHSFSRVLQWSPLRGDVAWLVPPPSPRRASRLVRHDERRVGTFSWPKLGTQTWPPVETFSWPRTVSVPINRTPASLGSNFLLERCRHLHPARCQFGNSFVDASGTSRVRRDGRVVAGAHDRDRRLGRRMAAGLHSGVKIRPAGEICGKADLGTAWPHRMRLSVPRQNASSCRRWCVAFRVMRAALRRKDAPHRRPFP